MTIISVHITDTSLLAVADSLISNNNPARVLAEDRKIQIFEPRFKVPHVSLGRFNYFSEYSVGNFGIGYAGNLSLISTTINAFQDVVRNCMFIDRDYEKGGKPQIYRQRNFEGRFKGVSYDDTYNFKPDELPQITVSLLVNILMSICQNTCLDFHKNAMRQPDLHFMVFGEELVGHNRCVRCEVIRIFGVDGNNLLFERISVLPNQVAMIGDQSAVNQLMSSIYTDPKFSTPPDERPRGTDDATFPEFPEYELSSRKEKNAETWASLRSQVMKLHTLTLIEKETNTIGGDSTLAEIGWTRPLHLSVIRKAELDREVAKLRRELS